MKRFNDMKTFAKLALLGGALAMASAPVAAVDYFLCAGATTKTLPDGSTVPMWGFAQDDDGDLSNGCANPVTVPGPRLTVPAGDGVLNITLRNDLPEPTSIVVGGLGMPVSTGAGPTWNDGTTGARGADTTKRVRSFGSEAPASGGIESYAFSVDRPGSYPYHSGTQPQKQVYMGLYGAVTQNAVEADATAGTPAEAYPGVAYDNEVVLFYSDIDPEHNASVDELYNPTGLVAPYSTSIHYHARWFLINGEPYVDGVTADIPAGAGGERTLLRLISAAAETHVPVVQGMHMVIHAEDALPYGWEDTVAGTSGPAPREQYSAMLSPLKSKDAIITLPSTVERFAVYDGNGYMTNPSDVNDFTVGDAVGGMLRFLSVGAATNTPPVANDDAATTAFETLVSIDVLANDTDADGDPLSIATFDATSVNGGAVSCTTTCDYTPPVGFSGTDTFTYQASDGTDLSNVATVTVTVEAVPNTPPVANDDAATTAFETLVSIDVLANDTDADGDPLSIATFDATSVNGGAVSCTTTCDYTPPVGFSGTDTFTYQASDGTDLSNVATVTVTVEALPNTPPVANDDAYATSRNTALTVAAPGVLGNDTDADGDPLTAVQQTGPTNGVLTLSPDGSFTYTPNGGFVGDDSFTYVANDAVDDSNLATVTITVRQGGGAP